MAPALASRAQRRTQVEAACATLRAACRQAGLLERLGLAELLLDTAYAILERPSPRRRPGRARPPDVPAA